MQPCPCRCFRSSMALRRVVWLAVSVAVFVTSSSIAFGGGEACKPAQLTPIPYAMAISGGISLGAYEAGLNWTLVRAMKLARRQELDDLVGTCHLPRLASVAGASAGSINAVLTAMHWALDEKAAGALDPDSVLDKAAVANLDDTVDRNLFRWVWLTVGIENLLPLRYVNYEDDDGLLSRRRIRCLVAQIADLQSLPVYDAGVETPVGLMLTKETAARVEVAGMTVKNQRCVVPLYAATDSVQGSQPGPLSFFQTPGRLLPCFTGKRHLSQAPRLPGEAVVRPLQGLCRRRHGGGVGVERLSRGFRPHPAPALRL